jgi:molybdate transport system substrate-binding protein
MRVGAGQGAARTVASAAAAACFALAAFAVPAQAAAIRVLTAGAYRGVLEDLAPMLEQRGHHLVIDNETAGVVAQKLRAGEPADLVILPPAAAETLGALLGPARPLAKVGIGMAVPAGAAVPDIATEAAVRGAVLAARAPAWIDPAAGGSSGIYLAKLWERWGIAGQLAPKAVLVQGGLVADAIRSGAADFGFQQVSELMAQPGVTVVGPLPAAIQSYTVYAGAVAAASTEPSEAAAVLALLAGPEARPALRGRGMEPPP